MKKTAFIIAFIVFVFTVDAQNSIATDTTIVKNIQKGESFELRFEFSPGSGYVWYLPDADSSTINIKQQGNEELKDGYFPIGGVYIYTYKYTGMAIGTHTIDYYFGRPWLKERLKKCSITVNVQS